MIVKPLLVERVVTTGTESLELRNGIGGDGWSGPGRSSQGSCSAEQSQCR